MTKSLFIPRLLDFSKKLERVDENRIIRMKKRFYNIHYIYYRAQGDNLRIDVSLYLKRGRNLPFRIILATILLVGMFLNILAN